MADAADDRFEEVCRELGILLARRVEPVSARVLPFGREQLAMVQLRDGSESEPNLLAAASHGRSRLAAVAGAAIDAMTHGNNVLAAALPGAVAEGKVRTAVVFAEGEAPVRWGRADDEGRLAALYAVVPHLGTFTATAGPDTYRVLRLPGVGVSLVTEGQSAAAWVEGWFAALIHATQYVLRPEAATDVVVAPRTPEPSADTTAVLAQLEEDCRRILASAQDQARQIVDEARREVAAQDEARRAEAERLESQRLAQLARSREDEARAARLADEEQRLFMRRQELEHEREQRRVDDERAVTEARRAVEREHASLLEAADRARHELLAEARRALEEERRGTREACDAMLEHARREVERLRAAAVEDAASERETMLASARAEVEALRLEAAQLLEAAARDREALQLAAARADERARVQPAPPDEGRWVRELVSSEARRAADDVLHEARRAAEEVLFEATRLRRQLLDDARADATALPSHAWVRPSAAAPPATPDHPNDEGRAAELALLTAAAESVSAMAALLGRVTATERTAADGDDDATTPLADVPKLFFGA